MTLLQEIRHASLRSLYDAAPADLYYGHIKPRVSHLIPLNPRAQSTSSTACARHKHYYLACILQSLKELGANIHVALSGQGLTAQKFFSLIAWQAVCRNLHRVAFGSVRNTQPTFTSRTWRNEITACTGKRIHITPASTSGCGVL